MELFQVSRGTSLLRALGVCVLPAVTQLALATVNFYVSPWGKDTWTGTLSVPNAARTDGPRASLAGAREAISVYQYRNPKVRDHFIVNVAPGTYPIASTLALAFNDSANTITFRSTTPRAAVLDGSTPVLGWTVPPSSFATRLNPRARAFVVCADLKAIGLNDFGALPLSYWWGNKNNVSSSYNELFVNGVRQTIARWPNVGYARVQSGTGKYSFQANISTTRVAMNDPAVSIYSFASGFDWGFEGMPATLNRSTGTVQVTPGLTYDSKAEGRFFLRNSLEEIDTPGEYYVDRGSGKLFWYPTAGYQRADIRISSNVGPVVNLYRAVNTTLDGFTIRNARGVGVLVTGGNNNSIVRCAISNVGGDAVQLINATNALVQSCTMNEMGEGGVRMEGGGDLATLTSGNNVVQDCKISGLGRLVPSYRAGILLAGVGNSALGNEISDGPHEGIQLNGAKLTVEGNHVKNVCRDTSDAGAIYAYVQAPYRGNVIRNNVVENVNNLIDPSLTPGDFVINGRAVGIWGIYLDNRSSGFQIEGNVLKSVNAAFMVLGGRDNKVVNNVTVDCPTAFQVDDRSDLAYAGLEAALATVPYQSGTWAATFPELVNILNDQPTFAKRNVFARNAIVNSSKMLLLRSKKMTTQDKETGLGTDEIGWKSIIATGLDAFVDPANGDYTPLPGTALADSGFKGIQSQSQSFDSVRFRRTVRP